MAPCNTRPAIAELRARIARIETQDRRDRSVLPFGIASVDGRLPGGGLPLRAPHEIAGGAAGAIIAAAAALFAAGILARVDGQILGCMTKADLFASATAQAGLDPDRVIYVEAGGEFAMLACFEEGSDTAAGWSPRSRACG